MIIISKDIKRKMLLILFSIASLILLAILLFAVTNKKEAPQKNYALPDNIDENIKITDNKALYKDEDIDKVWEIYIEAYTGVDEASGKLLDITEMNQQKLGQYDPLLKANAYIVDPSTGKVLSGFDTNKINCTISLRGQSSRRREQKSYKVKFNDDGGSFEGQSVLNLNKHYGDYTRVAQKFCFDMMTLFDNMVSLRTNFFRVYIKDGTKSDGKYEDYGLFTHVEQPNKTFLRAHGLDANGTLYKPSDFEFKLDDSIVEHTSPAFDYKVFSELLKIRENPDNIKLARMIEAVNDISLDFDEVFDQYFDKDNYLTWCAMNILFNNYDTMSRNFLLYSPRSSEKWYFLPWDYDATMLELERFESLPIGKFLGLARYWGTILHSRFYKNPDNVKLLDAKIDQLYEQLMSSNIDEICSRYLKVVNNNVFTSVDNTTFLSTKEYNNSLIVNLKQLVTDYYNSYYKSKEKPMPVFLGSVKEGKDGNLLFNWSPSYDLQADRIHYDFYIYTDLNNFENSIVYSDSTFFTEITVNKKLADGQYFWKVIIKDSNDNSQIAFDRYNIVNERGKNVVHIGLKKFDIINGKVEIEKTAGNDTGGKEFDSEDF